MKIKRIAVFHIDFIVILFITNSVSSLLFKDFNVGSKEYYVYAFLTFSLIILKDFLFKNASIGKKILNLKIVKTDGKELKWYDLIIRNIFAIIWPIEVILVLIMNKRIGDMITKTTIVEKEIY